MVIHEITELWYDFKKFTHFLANWRALVELKMLVNQTNRVLPNPMGSLQNGSCEKHDPLSVRITPMINRSD